MNPFLTINEIEQATHYVTSKFTRKPQIGLILGSGLGELAESIYNPVKIPTSEIPNWPISTVQGHKGQLVIGDLEGKAVIALQGRSHFYEGHSIARLGLPVRVMQSLGVKSLIITNAAGGINPHFTAGDLMLITDHIGLLTMTGSNPLIGPNLDQFGPRFPRMTDVYDPDYIKLAEKISAEQGLKVQKGVYACLSGPAFETSAEIRFLRIIGADAVGMSTVPEAIVAKHGDMRILGISGITNVVDPDGTNPASHQEVLEAGQVIVPKLLKLIRSFLPQM